MPILTIILVIVLVGVILWAVNQYVPMDPRIKHLLGIVVILVLIFWLLKVFGIWGQLGNVTI